MLYAIIPILWILSLSLKPQSDITDGSIVPKHFSWVNYSTIFNTGVFVRPLINSIGITLISTVIAVILATLAAYAIARLNFPGKKLVLSAALASPCSRRSRSSGRCSTCGARSASTTPGPA